MARPKAFITRTLLPEALEIVELVADVDLWPDEWPPSVEELHRRAAGVDGILTTIMDRVDAALMDAAPNLKVISQLAVGLDNVDVAEATRRGIPVGNTPGVLSKSTADLAFALLLGAARRTSESERWLRGGGWQLAFHPTHWLGQDVHGATLGIVGLGQIGREIARRAGGFDMRIIYHSRTRNVAAEDEHGVRYVDFPTLLGESDFVVLSVPLTPETHHLISAAELAAMKPTGILINVSRGPVVDPVALYEALRSGVIARAALDVTSPEPIPTDDPLLTLDNLVITPHIGSAALPTRLNTMKLAARNLVAGLTGEALEACANPEALRT
jgi:glyoxylate reductase